MFFVLWCLTFAGCSAEKQEDTKELSRDDTSVAFQISESVNGHTVQIPRFESKVDSTVVQELNQDISNLLVDLYDRAMADDTTDPMVVTDVFDGERYLQTVSRYVEYPLLGADSDVVSYNYDRIKDKRLFLSDALLLSDITLDDLKQEILDVYLTSEEARQQEVAVYGMTVDAFHIQESGQVTYWGKLVISKNEQEPWGYTFSYDFGTQMVTLMKEGE